jgi:hypothetical protein
MFQVMLAQMDETVRMALNRVDGKLCHLKIKRYIRDGDPFLYVHFLGSQCLIGSFKLNLDGST